MYPPPAWPVPALALALTLGPLTGCPGGATPSLPRTMDAGARAAPPLAPADLVAVVHLGHPRSTAAALTAATGRALPVDLALALGLGVDVSVLSAVETDRPVDLALLGSDEHPAYVMAFTPATASRARAALSPRYRFTTVPGLGERLEPRGDPGLSGSHRLPCALVAVPGPTASRVVCASDASTLTTAGRWMAFASDTRGNDATDLVATAEGGAIRRTLLPMAQTTVLDARRSLAAGAARARRAHDRAPDLGDPEALAFLAGDLGTEIDTAAHEIIRADLRVTVTDSDVDARMEVRLRSDGVSALARDARGRLGVAPEHPLAALLPPDATAALATRVASAVRAATLTAMIDAALRVLGARVLFPAAARADLQALVSHGADAAVVGMAPDVPDGTEVTAVLAQSDGGAAALAVLARMPRAPWVTSLRLGSAVTATAGPHGAVLLTLAPRAGVDPLPGTMALAVRAGALVMVIGRHAAASLAAVSARAGGPLPAVLGIPSASVVAGVDLAALASAAQIPGPQGSSGEATAGALRVGLTYGARQEPDGLVAAGRVTLPTAALGLAARLVMANGGGPTGGGTP